MKTQAQVHTEISPDEAKTIARDAWVFGLPLVYIGPDASILQSSEPAAGHESAGT
jgi:hypothetical protein